MIFRFPLECGEPGQNAKFRPCLVVGVEDANGERRLRIAFGSGVIDRRHRRDRIVSHPGDLTSAVLRRPTRFDLTRRLAVLPDDPRFVVSRHHGIAVIGNLDLADLGRREKRCGFTGRG